ncbi:MAG: peptidoglycan-binding protein [Bacilli bacterium]|nr:peptidoglycan-binding protein [Bacilli bacterium]
MSRYVKDVEWGRQFPNFRKSEFACPKYCNGYGNGIAKSLVKVLQTLRNKYGAVNITSGYRCKQYNSTLKGASADSWHLYGQAADFYFANGILGDQNKRIAIVNEIKKMPNVHWSYCNVNGNHPNMGSAIHVDCYLVDVDVMDLQSVLNSQYGCGLAVDGSFGNLTGNACSKNYLYYGKNAPIHIKWLQNRLIQLGYSVGASGADGQFGNDTLNAVKKFQQDNGLAVDGYVGKETHLKLVI